MWASTAGVLVERVAAVGPAELGRHSEVQVQAVR